MRCSSQVACVLATVLAVMGVELFVPAGRAEGSLPVRREEVQLAAVEMVDRDLSFEVNTRWVLNLRNDAPRMLQARVFPGDRTTLLKRPFGVEDGCWVYRSIVERPTIRGRQLDFGAAPEWYLRRSGSDVYAKTYVVVFEEGRVGSGQFALEPEDVASYFEDGYEITFNPPSNLTPLSSRELIERVDEKLESGKLVRPWRTPSAPSRPHEAVVRPVPVLLGGGQVGSVRPLGPRAPARLPCFRLAERELDAVRVAHRLVPCGDSSPERPGRSRSWRVRGG